MSGITGITRGLLPWVSAEELGGVTPGRYRSLCGDYLWIVSEDRASRTLELREILRGSPGCIGHDITIVPDKGQLALGLALSAEGLDDGARECVSRLRREVANNLLSGD